MIDSVGKDVFALSRIWSRSFAEDYIERAIGTFCQALLGALPVAFMTDIDWINALYVALFATGVFALKGLAAAATDSDTGASFGTAIPRENVRTVIDDESPTEISSDSGSDLEPGTPVLPEEPLGNK